MSILLIQALFFQSNNIKKVLMIFSQFKFLGEDQLSIADQTTSRKRNRSSGKTNL
jgi:hypothetical protein